MHSYLPTGSTDPSKCRATAGLAESIIIANRPTSRLHRECVRTRTRVRAQVVITSQSDSVFAQKMCSSNWSHSRSHSSAHGLDAHALSPRPSRPFLTYYSGPSTECSFPLPTVRSGHRRFFYLPSKPRQDSLRPTR